MLYIYDKIYTLFKIYVFFYVSTFLKRPGSAFALHVLIDRNTVNRRGERIPDPELIFMHPGDFLPLNQFTSCSFRAVLMEVALLCG